MSLTNIEPSSLHLLNLRLQLIMCYELNLSCSQCQCYAEKGPEAWAARKYSQAANGALSDM